MWAKLVLAAAVVLVGACGANTGPSDRGEVRVTLARSPNDSLAAGSANGAVLIPRAVVDSLILTITAVEAIRANASDDEADDPDGFQRLRLTGQARQPIELLTLPPENPGTSGLPIADGDVEENTYNRIRLRFDPNTARIFLREPVTIDGVVIAAGQHRLVIPTGAQTGIQIGVTEFTVRENIRTDVEVVFNPIRSLSEVRIRGDTVFLKPTFQMGRVDQ